MGRSKEAVQRRAEKRQRSEKEQWQADKEDMRKQEKRARQQADDGNNGNNRNDSNFSSSKSFTRSTPPQMPSHATNEDPLKEVGAWNCKMCGNSNFASRQWCNSKMCDEPRPSDIPMLARRRPTPLSFRGTSSSRNAHASKRSSATTTDAFQEPGAWKCSSCSTQNFASRDTCFGEGCDAKRPEGSSTVLPNGDAEGKESEETQDVVWGKQADPSTIKKNKDLRQLYAFTAGKGMTEQDIERAKLLIERDQRKREKRAASKALLKKNAKQAATKVSAEKAVEAKNPSKSKVMSTSDKNKALRKKFLDGGKGMRPDEISRAKTLIARDERKKKARMETTGKETADTKTDEQETAAQ